MQCPLPLANFTNTGTLNLNGSGTISGITNNTGGTINLASSGTITSLTNATATSTLNISASTVPTITTLTATAAGNTVNYTGAAQTGAKVTTYSNLTLSGSGAKTFATNPTVNGVLSLEDTASVIVSGGTGVVTYGANATLRYNKPAAYPATAEEWITPFAATGGVIIANTGVITMNNAKTFNAGVPLTINSGSTLNTATFSNTFSSTSTVTINGTFQTANTAGFSGAAGTAISSTNSPTITLGGSSTIEYSATAGGQAVTGRTYANLTLDNTSGTNTANGAVTVNNTFTTTAGGTLNMGTNALSAATVANSGIIRTQNTSATPLSTGKTWGGTVSYDATTGGQTVVAGTYGVLTLGNTSGTQTAGGALTVTTLNNNTNAADVLNMSTNTLAVTTVNNSGTIRTQNTSAAPLSTGLTWGGTVNYDAATGGQTVVAGTYGVLTLGNTSGTQNAGGALTVTTLNNNTNAADILNMGTNTLTVTTVNNTGTIRTQNTSATPLSTGRTWGGTVVYDGVAQTVSSGTYNDLTLSGSGAKTLPSTGMATIGGNLTLAGAATTTTVAGLTINGNLTVGDGTALNAAGFPLTVTGTTTVGGGASGTLAISSATGTKTFTGPVVINYGASLIETAPAQLAFGSELTVNSGGTLSENGAAVVGIAGSLLNNGTYSASTGVHTLTGTAKTVGGANPVVIPNLTVSGTTTNNGTLTVSTALAGTGTLTNGANAVLNVGSSAIAPTLVASAAGNTVNYTGTAQTVKATAYSNLILSGSGDKALTSGTSVSGNLSIAPTGTAKASIGSGLALNVGGLTMGGLSRASGSWGSTSSPATNQNDTYFAATSGYLAVTSTVPSFTSPATVAFTFDAANSFTVTTAGTGPITFDYQGGLPTGVSFKDNGNGTATISGSPNTASTFRLTIIAASSFGSATQSFILTVTLPGGVSAADTEISVTPNRHLFGVVTLAPGACGAPFTFTVRNSGTTPRILGTLAIGGNDADQYSIGAINTCSASTLATGTSCTVEVTFCPTSTGSKSASLLIPSNDPESPILTAALYNYESLEEEAARRMSPVLESLYIPATMNAGQQYTITWSQLGYDEDYVSRIVFFKCAGLPAGTCGDSYSSNFADSGNLVADSTSTTLWSYTNGAATVYAKKFDYSYTFSAPVAGDIVIRFYHKSMSDSAAGLATLSVLIPGKLNPSGTTYYDNQGRRLLYTIAP